MLILFLFSDAKLHIINDICKYFELNNVNIIKKINGRIDPPSTVNLTEIIEEMRSDEGGIVGIKKMSESDRFAHIEMPVV